MTLAQRGSSMIHRTLPHTHVSRSPRYAQEYRRRPSPGGAHPDVGRVAARAVRLSAGPPYLAVVCHRAQPDGDRCRALLLPLQRVPYRAGLSGGLPATGTRRPRAARSTSAHHGAAAHVSPLAAGPAQGHPTDVRVVSHALELL